jgi:hypothetical protein
VVLYSFDTSNPKDPLVRFVSRMHRRARAGAVAIDAGEAEASFLALPLFASLLPFRFPNGCVFTSFQAGCPGCSRDAPEDRTRGRVYHPTRGDYRTLDISVLVLDARAYCPYCAMYFSCLYRLCDDLHLEGESPAGEGEAVWPPRTTFWSRMKNWLRTAWRRSWSKKSKKRRGS